MADRSMPRAQARAGELAAVDRNKKVSAVSTGRPSCISSEPGLKHLASSSNSTHVKESTLSPCLAASRDKVSECQKRNLFDTFLKRAGYDEYDESVSEEIARRVIEARLDTDVIVSRAKVEGDKMLYLQLQLSEDDGIDTMT